MRHSRRAPMSNRSAMLLPALLAVFAVACGGDSTGPGDPAAGPRIEIAPGALLLTAAGATEALHVRAFDADGHEMTAPSVTWRSSDQAVVTVGSDGLATAIAGAGSAHIIADAGDLVSPPILVVIAEPAEGAVLVADSQVVGTLEPVSVTAAYQPGWQYQVHLIGITPVPGQILLASGGAPVAGRVVSATPGAGGESIVTLELLPLNQLFRSLSVNESLPLTAIVPRVSGAAASFYRATTTRSGTTLTRRATGPVFATASSRAESEFELGPFECKAESGIEVASFSLDPGPLTITPALSLDLVLDATGLRRLVAHGSITAKQLLKPRLTGTATGKVDCNATPLSIPFPVSGPLGFFVSGALPVGAGFELGTEITTGTIGADLDLAANATIAVGVACDAGCHPVADLSANTDGTSAKPVLPSIGNSFRAKFTGSEYAYAKFAVGNAFIQSLQIGLLEAKLGVTQEFDLASKEYQAADPAYASSFLLKPLVSAGTTLNIAQGAAMLGIEIPPLSFEPEFDPSAQSPHGTFTITPASVRPGSGGALGDQATFNIHLDPVNYLGVYSVESVEIRWVRAGTSGTGITLDPGRPGCTTLEAAQDQADFTCTTDFTASQTGEHTFYAFVHARIFGVPIATPLELAADGKATVVVGEGGGVTVTPSSVTVAPGGTRQFSASIAGGGDQSVMWSATGGTISNSGLYTAGQSTGQFSVTATSIANPSATGSAQVTISTSFIPGATYVGTRRFQGSPTTENPAALIFNATNTQMIQCTIPSAGNQPNTYREACATAGAPFTNQSGYFLANVTVSGGSVTGTLVDVTGTFTGTIEGSKLTGQASFPGGLFNTYDTTRR